MDSPGYMSCALKIDTQTGWHKSLIKMLTNIDGVSYSIDAQQGIAYISGKVDPGKILTMLAKSGKHAELCWIDSGQNPNRVPFSNGYGHPNVHDNNGYNNPYYTTTGYGYGYGDPYYNHSYMMQPELHTSVPMTTALIHEPLPPGPSVPFYEPEPKYFPQPPPPPAGLDLVIPSGATLCEASNTSLCLCLCFVV
ncbi:hypothetical protein LWI28_022553 [Acer negundo]|uniref:HMA domain-containing protein n=1 Tax=Acer negundo TaxID=4023 RepID=A0AAD5IGN1_ACENE|nr:hypothetical protein LWI28_022553 [Acer negundo]